MYPYSDLFIFASSVGEASNFCVAPRWWAPPIPRIRNKWVDGRCAPAAFFHVAVVLVVYVCVIFSTHASPRPRPLPFVRRRVEKNRAAVEKMRSHPPAPQKGQGKGGGFANRTVVGNWRVDGWMLLRSGTLLLVFGVNWAIGFCG